MDYISRSGPARVHGRMAVERRTPLLNGYEQAEIDKALALGDTPDE